MLSQTEEYALRAMWCLVRQGPARQGIERIARETEVPRDYLYKVLQRLVGARLLRSRRGKGGGFLLAREPESISLRDIIAAVSPFDQITHCPLNNREYCARVENGRSGLCPLHASIREAQRLFESRLESIFLSDLVRRVHEVPGLSHRRRPEAGGEDSRR